MARRLSRALCLVEYRTKSGLSERLWNSLSSEPPVRIHEVSAGEVAYLVVSEPPDYQPDYVPAIGERVIVALDECTERLTAASIVDDESMPPAVLASFLETYPSRDDAIARVIQILREEGAVDLAYVTSAIRERFVERARLYRESGEADLARELGVFVGVGNPDAALLKFFDRDGNPISLKQHLNLFRQYDYRVVAETLITPGCVVTTMWLGISDGSSSRLFETAEIRRDAADNQYRAFVQRGYSTEADALIGHAECVRIARERT